MLLLQELIHQTYFVMAAAAALLLLTRLFRRKSRPGLAYDIVEEALTEFLQSTVTDETFVDGFVALCSLHRRLGDREASQAALERAGKVGPANAVAHVALGVNAYLAKDAAAARGLFRRRAPSTRARPPRR